MSKNRPNLYQRNGIWYGRFSINGHLQRVSLKTGELRLARRKLIEVRAEAEAAARAGMLRHHSWQHVVALYARSVLDTGSVRDSTAKRYRVSLRQIDPYFGSLAAEQIDNAQLTRFIMARQADGATNATIRRDLTVITRVLAYAKAIGLIDRNPAAEYDRRFVREVNAPIDPPSDETIEMAIAALPPFWEPLLRWLRGTGTRLHEALWAEWEHTHSGNITLMRTKGGRIRTIAVPPEVWPERQGHHRLFPDFPEDSSQVSDMLNKSRRRLPDLPRFRLHDLRHAYAIAQIRAGRDIYDLSRHLGHSTVKVTERYLGYVPRQRSPIER